MGTMVADVREEDLLMRIECEVALHDAHLDGRHVLGALRHDDAVGAVAG